MPLFLMNLLMQLAGEVPTLEQDAVSLFNSVAHGEGGVQKVQNVAANLATLATHANAAVASATAAQATVAPKAA